uniref:B30.2/SPRY domain-containing protein n=1 Tax=Podarcis muralis TaxID=64176 RepID=A0A670HPA1_PODMU
MFNSLINCSVHKDVNTSSNTVMWQAREQYVLLLFCCSKFRRLLLAIHHSFESLHRVFQMRVVSDPWLKGEVGKCVLFCALQNNPTLAYHDCLRVSRNPLDLKGNLGFLGCYLFIYQGVHFCLSPDSAYSSLSLIFSPTANVTLDPDTAHPELFLSEDRKSVRWKDEPQALPDNPERFNAWPCVLGREGFTGGRHFWEVTVGSGEYWDVGVARKSVERKGEYWACTSPFYSPLSLRKKPRRIRVTLDYEGGRVSFSDADSGAELYTFSGASFSGETLLPYFDLGWDQSPSQLCNSRKPSSPHKTLCSCENACIIGLIED